ncbi:thiol-disulfide oxidoreductase DCC family protein [Methylobacterium phyllosphaerae]
MEQVVVWFDGGCPLCRREIALMRRLDRRGAITFIDVAEDAGACPASRADMLARFHAREGGRVLTGAAAFAAMWRAIPILRPLGLLARSGMALSLLERLYGLFLRVRPWLQRLVQRFDQPRVRT